MPKARFSLEKLWKTLKRKIMKSCKKLAIFTNSQKVYIRRKKNIHATNEAVQLRPAEIPDKKIEQFIRPAESLQLSVGIFFGERKAFTQFFVCVGENYIPIFFILFEQILNNLQGIYSHPGNALLLKASGIDSDSHSCKASRASAWQLT
jgi:hypothetical protein